MKRSVEGLLGGRVAWDSHGKKKKTLASQLDEYRKRRREEKNAEESWSGRVRFDGVKVTQKPAVVAQCSDLEGGGSGETCEQ